ncbi:SDR family oxidoreductase [Nocardia sp. NPDC005825]|uniref:SDR family NAD(P)-dependent oxidoreductase n=1 Tax=unclassified Nocardia TaxID=2637762 RepID=UPI0033CDA463
MSDKLALITGAAGGIGVELGRRLSRRGYRVIAVERNEMTAREAVRQIGDGAIAVACDLSDATAVEAICARVQGEWADGLEIVIANAGVIVPGDATQTTAQDVDLELDVNLRSAMHLSAAAARVMVARKRGHILATVSMGGIIAMPGSAVYSAGKAGLRAYLCALSCELRGTGVAVSGIYPSAVDTEMLYHEALGGGSMLNFVGKVSSIPEVADTYERALDGRKLEYYLPYGDSIGARVVQSFPWLLPYLLGPLNKLGKRGFEKYLRKRQHSACADRLGGVDETDTAEDELRRLAGPADRG